MISNMTTIIFALVAYTLHDRPATMTITYHATIAECQTKKYEIETKIDKDLVRLDCIPLKVKDVKFD